MCLLVIAWEVHPRYRLVVAANRDEFHKRAAEPLALWPPPDNFLAGRDRQAGGTWLAIDGARRFGVVTNFRELQRPAPGAPSRGNLIPDYLRAEMGAEEYLRRLEANAANYSGFNLLLTDQDSLWYASNRAPSFRRRLSPGIYGLSNEFLDTPWPKLRRVRRQFEAWLSERGDDQAALFSILADRTQAGVNDHLPQTGLSHEWEQLLSSPFICNADYGTRCSTTLLLEPAGALRLTERRFDSDGRASGDTDIRLSAGEWP